MHATIASKKAIKCQWKENHTPSYILKSVLLHLINVNCALTKRKTWFE